MLTIDDYPFKIFKDFNSGLLLPKTFMKAFPCVHTYPAISGRAAIAGWLLGLCLLLQSCQQEHTSSPLVLMKIGDRVVTVDEYRRDLNIYRMATGENTGDDPAAEHEMQIRFAQQLADQLVLLEHARALGIEVTDLELDKALQGLQRDYPDDVFEQLLLENAITLEEWRASLRTRLIIERVIAQELEAHIRISEEDVAQFMAQLRSDSPDAQPGGESGMEAPSDKFIVAQLRRSKMETAYAEWIAALKKKYPVEINQAVLNTVLSDSADTG